ncbi:MAG TPA: hypothetical protein VMU08_13620 [Rhizomicrobium sp.]|nr:hypothetical protein [Rhizomicrobium sp.]
MQEYGSDRPMTEYESALSGMVRVMLDAIVGMGASKVQLAKEFKSLKDSEKIAGRHAAAATIEITMRSAGLR